MKYGLLCVLKHIIISRRTLAREGDYKMHPLRVYVSVSCRFLQNCYSYRFFCKLIVLMNFHALEKNFGFVDLGLKISNSNANNSNARRLYNNLF